MANMSYCRFENTFGDLKDCLQALNRTEISIESERKFARKLITEFLDWCQTEGIINEYDLESIDKIITECEYRYEP